MNFDSHVFLWRAHFAIPMWSGEWTAPVGTSMAKGYVREIADPWRQVWIEQNTKDSWKQVTSQINKDIGRYFGVENE